MGLGFEVLLHCLSLRPPAPGRQRLGGPELVQKTVSPDRSTQCFPGEPCSSLNKAQLRDGGIIRLKYTSTYSFSFYFKSFVCARKKLDIERILGSLIFFHTLWIIFLFWLVMAMSQSKENNPSVYIFFLIDSLSSNLELY